MANDIPKCNSKCEETGVKSAGINNVYKLDWAMVNIAKGDNTGSTKHVY